MSEVGQSTRRCADAYGQLEQHSPRPRRDRDRLLLGESYGWLPNGRRSTFALGLPHPTL